MSFVVPPLPGERLLTPKEVADRAGCHVSAIYGFINDGKIAAVTVADRLLIAESEAEKLLKEWPSRNRGVSARWRAYRVWKAGQDAASLEGGAR
jgi:excisionase family DNA binding protein